MPLESRADGLNILILNWRDLRHPRSGGAEVLTQGHARRLVERGHRVTVFVGRAKGTAKEEIVDGVRVVRRGGPVSTRLHALRWYRRETETHGSFDVVVEEVNTLPYLLGRITGAPALLWMHQLAREVWWHEASKVLAPVGYAVERSYLRLYRPLPAVVLSRSTKEDLLALGFRDRDVAIVPPAIDPPALAPDVAKEPGLLVYVGRVAPSKRVGHLVRALASVRQAGIDARLDVVGRGPKSETESIVRLAGELGVAPFVRYRGYVDGAEKNSLLARAALVVMASVREGWGLAVTEANALGTPAVVYDRPGLRDSTVHEKSGLVTQPDPTALSAGIVRALSEPGLYERLRRGALDWSRGFTWERASAEFERALEDVAARRWRERMTNGG
jgi:glycosyltransferase involved in cell wall biosynthesis